MARRCVRCDCDAGDVVVCYAAYSERNGKCHEIKKIKHPKMVWEKRNNLSSFFSLVPFDSRSLFRSNRRHSVFIYSWRACASASTSTSYKAKQIYIDSNMRLHKSTFPRVNHYAFGIPLQFIFIILYARSPVRFDVYIRRVPCTLSATHNAATAAAAWCMNKQSRREANTEKKSKTKLGESHTVRCRETHTA